MSTQQKKISENIHQVKTGSFSDVALYPVDMSSFLSLPREQLGSAGVPHQVSPPSYNPTMIVHHALAIWNRYLTTTDERHRTEFMAQVNWLIEHKRAIGDNASGWPIYFARSDFHTNGPWLSATAQGCGISVLVRAYQLSREEDLLEVIRCVVHTFERDILDGGVSTPMGEDSVFFEEVAVYPAAHILSGFIFALFGLYDYLALTRDIHIERLISRGLAAMHRILDEFDAGFWTYSDLLHRRLASSSEVNLQSMLLAALATYSGCDHCSLLAQRWEGYRHKRASRLRYLIADKWHSCKGTLLERVRNKFFPVQSLSNPSPVCIALPSFPVLGGILTVLEGIEQVMKNIWRIEYLTQYVGPQPERFVIHRFGTAKTSPWHFPLVWLYAVTGVSKLLSLMLRGASYRVILPQDGIYTGAFTAIVAKLTGTRVVCIDHGDLSLFSTRNHSIYRSEHISMLMEKDLPWLVRFVARLCSVFYWPTRSLLARISARFIDYFLIPGVMDDGVEEIGKDLGIPVSRIVRYPSMIDVQYHVVLDAATKAIRREALGISADAIVVSIICRFAPEKGLDIALESISRALTTLAPEISARLRVLIVGGGPLHEQIETDIHARKLDQTCLLWGEASKTEVLSLLSISDIFLYTSTRGACFAMAVLEAMASCCAVIASNEPISNALLLAEGRGIAVPAYDVEQTSNALVQLINNQELCSHMGSLARDYIATYHSPASFRRTLMRATYWSELDMLLKRETHVEYT
jgi:glycosyltransferase involved in cell wall biosynthesis